MWNHIFVLILAVLLAIFASAQAQGTQISSWDVEIRVVPNSCNINITERIEYEFSDNVTQLTRKIHIDKDYFDSIEFGSIESDETKVVVTKHALDETQENFIIEWTFQNASSILFTLTYYVVGLMRRSHSDTEKNTIKWEAIPTASYVSGHEVTLSFPFTVAESDLKVEPAFTKCTQENNETQVYWNGTDIPTTIDVYFPKQDQFSSCPFRPDGGGIDWVVFVVIGSFVSFVIIVVVVGVLVIIIAATIKKIKDDNDRGKYTTMKSPTLNQPFDPSANFNAADNNLI